MTPWTLRTAAPPDLDAVLALWREHGETPGRRPDDRAAIDTLLARDPQALLLAEQHGAVIGAVIAGWDGWRAHLYRLVVHADHRRCGVGQALLAAAEQRLVALGARRLDALVHEHNELGAAIWSAARYSPQDDWRRWVRNA